LQRAAGWRGTPATATIEFAHEDEALSARFRVTAPASVKIGEYPVQAVVTSDATGGETFGSGYQEIEYPHVQRRQVMKPAVTSVKVIDVKTAPGLNVGYIVGVGDQVPPAIQQLGAKVSFIEADQLAWGGPAGDQRTRTGVAVGRDRQGRARVRAARRPAGVQPPAAGVRGARRHGAGAVQQDGIQPAAVRAVPGACDRRSRGGRERAGRDPAERGSRVHAS